METFVEEVRTYYQCLDNIVDNVSTVTKNERYFLRFYRIFHRTRSTNDKIATSRKVEIYSSTVSYGRLSRDGLRSNGQLLRKLLYLQWHLSLCETMKLKHYYITYTRAESSRGEHAWCHVRRLDSRDSSNNFSLFCEVDVTVRSPSRARQRVHARTHTLNPLKITIKI